MAYPAKTHRAVSLYFFLILPEVTKEYGADIFGAGHY